MAATVRESAPSVLLCPSSADAEWRSPGPSREAPLRRRVASAGPPAQPSRKKQEVGRRKLHVVPTPCTRCSWPSLRGAPPLHLPLSLPRALPSPAPLPAATARPSTTPHRQHAAQEAADPRKPRKQCGTAEKGAHSGPLLCCVRPAAADLTPRTHPPSLPFPPLATPAPDCGCWRRRTSTRQPSLTSSSRKTA